MDGVFCRDFLGWQGQRTVKPSRWTGAPKAFVLRQGAEDHPVAEVFRKLVHGMRVDRDASIRRACRPLAVAMGYDRCAHPSFFFVIFWLGQ